MDKKILLTLILNKDFNSFSEVLEKELDSAQYNYTMNDKEMDSEIIPKKMDSYLNYRSTLFSLLAHMKYYENDSCYYDALINHHKKFNNINIYSLWRDENLLFSHSFNMFIKDFISLGMNSKLRNKQGDTPMMYAVRTNRLELLEVLIDAKADYKSRDKNGSSILMFAALQNESALSVLLQHDKFNQLKELKKLKQRGLRNPEIQNLLDEKLDVQLEKRKFEFLLSHKKETTKVRMKL